MTGSLDGRLPLHLGGFEAHARAPDRPPSADLRFNHYLLELELSQFSLKLLYLSLMPTLVLADGQPNDAPIHMPRVIPP